MAKDRDRQMKQDTPPPKSDCQEQHQIQTVFFQRIFNRRKKLTRRSLVSWLLLTRLGLLVLLVTSGGVTTLFLVYQEAIANASHVTWGTLLKEAGVAWGGALLWVVAFLVTLRVQPRLLVRFWYRWLSGLVLMVPLAALLAQFNVGFGQPKAYTLGGDLGMLIAGPSLWTAIPVVKIIKNRIINDQRVQDTP